MPPKETQQPTHKKRSSLRINGASRKADAGGETKTSARRTRRPNSTKARLKQYAYYKFKNDIAIYHYQASFVSVRQFRSLLNREQHGYVASLLGPDLLGGKSIADGDEMSKGCVEACYLLGVFQHGGSALGFRLDKDTVEWLCFDRDIKAMIIDKLDIQTPTAKMLFEHVASVAKPAFINKSRRVPYTEHKDWFDSLRLAERRPFRLGLTWRNSGTELRNEHARLREMSGARQGAEVLVETDSRTSKVSDAEGEDSPDDERDEEEPCNSGSDEAQCQDDAFNREHGQEMRISGNEEAMERYQRTTESSPMTIGRSTSPPVYSDSSPLHGSTPSRNVSQKNFPSSSRDSVLSNQRVDTLQTQYRPSADQKARDQHLMNGAYI